MKNLLFGIAATLALTGWGHSALANEVGQETLLNAITMCPAETNPLNALKELNGNVFINVKSGEDAGTVTMNVEDVPTNIHMRRPSVIRGYVYVEMRHDETGALKCGYRTSPVNR